MISYIHLPDIYFRAHLNELTRIHEDLSEIDVHLIIITFKVHLIMMYMYIRSTY